MKDLLIWDIMEINRPGKSLTVKNYPYKYVP